MNQRTTCPRCARSNIDVMPGEREFAAITQALENGSRGLAAAEFRVFAQCTDSDAVAWIDHLLTCAQAWPGAAEDDAILARIDDAFAHVVKPGHFTNYTHCSECKEHDDTLRARTRESLRRQDLGNNGWNPITFASDEGVGYYFPSLARFALLPDAWRDHDWYASLLVPHLAQRTRADEFLGWCSPLQRAAVGALLAHLSLTRATALARHGLDGDLQVALAAWGAAAVASDAYAADRGEPLP